MKLKLTFFLIQISFFVFSQEKINEKVTINGYDFTIKEAENPENKESTFYELKRIVNDSVLQSLTISKASNENGQSMISEFKIIDNVFVFPKTYKSDNGTNYGIDRVFITENGKLFEATENGIQYSQKPLESDYKAQYIGGINAFRNRISNSLDANDYIGTTDLRKILVNLKIVIDRDGNPSVKDIIGDYPPKLKEDLERIINRLPRWIPAKENNQTIPANFSLPINILLE